MDSGMTVYRAYVSDSAPELNWVTTGVVTEIVSDGVPLVRAGTTLSSLDDRWRATRHDAERDIHRALVRHIGKLQAKADELRDRILQATLCTEEVAA